MTQTVFKINLASGDLEVSGSEEFVSSTIDKLPELLAELGKDSMLARGQSLSLGADHQQESNEVDNVISTEDNINNNSLHVPESFGEWKQKFKDGLTQDFKILIAGFFCQGKSSENVFKTKEANDVLKDHGIKVANAAQSLGSLEESKYVFVAKKSGKLKLYRVTETGTKQLESLLSAKPA